MKLILTCVINNLSFQVYASSLENARRLYLENKDDYEISNGILIGAPHFHLLTNEDKNAVEDQVQCNVEAVETFRSVFMPLHCSPNGKLYRKGDCIIALSDGSGVIAKVENFCLLDIEGKWTSLAILNIFEPLYDDDENIIRHPISETIIVKATVRKLSLPVTQIQRQIMLYPDSPNTFAVVDPSRDIVPLPRVIVPLYPETGDFISVQGQSDEIWTANVVNVSYRQKTVDAYFFIKHNNFLSNQLWIKEKPTRKQVIHWSSILAILEGEWHGTYWKQK